MVALMINMLFAMKKGLRAKINVWWFNLDIKAKYRVTRKAQCRHGDWR